MKSAEPSRTRWRIAPSGPHHFRSPLLYPCWTQREICAMSETGDWFYGLVRTHRGVMLAEVYPGIGFSRPFWTWRPRNWWWAVRDIWAAYNR